MGYMVVLFLPDSALHSNLLNICWNFGSAFFFFNSISDFNVLFSELYFYTAISIT